MSTDPPSPRGRRERLLDASSLDRLTPLRTWPTRSYGAIAMLSPIGGISGGMGVPPVATLVARDSRRLSSPPRLPRRGTNLFRPASLFFAAQASVPSCSLVRTHEPLRKHLHRAHYK